MKRSEYNVMDCQLRGVGPGNIVEFQSPRQLLKALMLGLLHFKNLTLLRIMEEIGSGFFRSGQIVQQSLQKSKYATLWELINKKKPNSPC